MNRHAIFLFQKIHFRKKFRVKTVNFTVTFTGFIRKMSNYKNKIH